MNILGLSAFYHDSAAALLCDGEIVAAAQEERFSRKKHDADFPSQAVRFCLEYSGLELSDVDLVVFYDKPLLKFERLLETYYHFVPRGIRSFTTAMPRWIGEKLFLRRVIERELSNLGTFDPKKQKLLFPEHHLSHAASAFFASPFRESVIVTVDGVGEWATASICLGKDNQIKIVDELRFPHSVGLLYSSFTYFLGFAVNDGEYKLMGLAPYGDASSAQVKKYLDIIYRELIAVREDGSVWLNPAYFSYATTLRMIPDDKWTKLFGFRRRRSDDSIEQHHCDLACAVQCVTEDLVKKMARHAQNLAESKEQAEHLCLAGGVALNCVANGKLIREGWFRDVFIQPAAGDAGGALGAALAAHYIYKGKQRSTVKGDSMKGAYLGCEFSDAEVLKVLRKRKAQYVVFDDFEKLTTEVATLLSEGKVVGWFQGRMEFGPRALGNRSILADARLADMQKRLNLKIKNRESFRPFAPAVLAERAGEYFDLNGDSPYMLVVSHVRKERCLPRPEHYHTLGPLERLNLQRSDIPAVTHLDYSARVQTVHRNTNPRFAALLDAYAAITGCGVLVNTSFNVRDEPIVCTPEDAYRCFMGTDMDCLVMGNVLLYKEQQVTTPEEYLRVA